MGILEMGTSDLLEEPHMDVAVSESSSCSPPRAGSSHCSLQWIPSKPRTEKRLESASGLLQQNTGPTSERLVHSERYTIRHLFSFQNITCGKTLGPFLRFVLWQGAGGARDSQCGR